ncbi:MAG: MGMT family protein [Rhodopila sp.]|nr:MGMT family protein [Rhodopila sp.]
MLISVNEKERTMNTINQDLKAEMLRFGYGESKMGLVLVALTNRGVAAILLGNDRQKLQRELRGAFADVQLIEDEAGLAETIAKVVALVDAPHCGLDLPLDLRGSELELAVWAALRAIPSGETRTYGALAKALPYRPRPRRWVRLVRPTGLRWRSHVTAW